MTTPDDVAAEECVAMGAVSSALESFRSRETKIGSLAIHRALPVHGRRLVGPWCFLDRFGPLSFGEGTPLDVGAHPHIGIQTVSWLLDGEIVHYDTLGDEALLRPGGVNVMTSGAAIAHAEQTPRQNSGRLNGVQLWTALPDAHRNDVASFQNLTTVPTLVLPGGIVRVFSGAFDHVVSPALHHSDIIGVELRIHRGEALNIPLEKAREHAVLVLDGDCAFENQPLAEHTLYYLGVGRTETTFRSDGGARVLLIGGLPFQETILMWWNFVARTTDEIRDARNDWQEHRRFGEIGGFKGSRIKAPELMRLAAPDPMI